MRGRTSKIISEILPRELVDLIIDQLAGDRASLHTCSIVCRSWMARSRYYLFSDILLRGSNCNNILDLPSPSAFSAAARRLMLAEKNILPPGIEHFTSVKSFYLTLSNANFEMVIGIPLLFSKITTFELNQVVFAAFDDVVQLVCSLPRLETFTLFMCPWIQERDAPPAHLCLPGHLRTLNILSPRFHVFLDWCNALDTLPPISSVRFYRISETHIHSIGAIIKRLGSSLQHLTLDLWDEGDADLELLPDVVDLGHNPNLLSFTLLNGWPKLLQELLRTHIHSSLQRASLTIYEGKGNIPNLFLLNWAELDYLVTSPGTAFRLTELTICICLHQMISNVTREIVETHFLPRSGAKGLVKFVPRRERTPNSELGKMLASPITRRSWSEHILDEE
ncbi:hypothetical protein C0991_001714, partial [Blastosporella zonata]